MGLWRHSTHKDIAFTLIVDDFGIKYSDMKTANHILDTLRKLYTITVDWTGKKYSGFTIDWNYEKRYVDISMPGYVDQCLLKYQHEAPTKPEYAPHTYLAPIYGAKIQYAQAEDTAPELNKKGITRIQGLVGTLLWYARSVDPTMLLTLNAIGAEQATATVTTAKAMTKLLNYCATNPEAIIRYRASDMILKIHSDGSYLSAPKARSRAGGHFYLGSQGKNTENNGPILNIAKIMRNVMALAAEVKTGALFLNCGEAVPIQQTLEDLGHPQPPTPVQVDNTTAEGFANDTIKQKRSKAFDMRFYWIKDRVQQNQYMIYWKPGSTNKADYFTKFHSPQVHRTMRPFFLLK